jgi:EAL domain-containing protein (putative c-di-GMP-specific phosphodiesterase class I)
MRWFLALNIGVISPKLPTKCLSLAQAPEGSIVFWFNEIEASYAFLLNAMLDKLYIDQELLAASYAYTNKYKKLIEQLHPFLEIKIIDFKVFYDSHLDDNIKYFPKLDILFKNGDLKSVFQPIIEINGNTNAIHGIECLSRFYYNGQRLPPEFIFNYAAEKLKLTNSDKICLMQALSLVPHDQNTLIFINLRPQTLISAGFCLWLKELLKKHQLFPEQVVIEVTEQYCNISENEMKSQCINLKNLGIKLAIDDFGSGISNLSMLEVMQPSYLKISGRFIKKSHEDINKQKIIKNVLELALDFGIVAVVESVEIKQEWAQAQALGARLAQGFYFFKPMDDKSLLTLFRNFIKSPSF